MSFQIELQKNHHKTQQYTSQIEQAAVANFDLRLNWPKLTSCSK